MAVKQKEKTIRVGALVTSAAIVLMVFLFFIGSEQKVFSRKNEYKVRFGDASGLAEGNPVKISGVTVGVGVILGAPGWYSAAPISTIGASPGLPAAMRFLP